MALALSLAGAAEGRSLIQKAVVAYLGGLAYHYPRAVVYKEPLAYLRGGVDLYSGKEFPELRKSARGGLKVVDIKPVGYAVDDNRVEPRIGQEYLYSRTRGGVALADGIYLFF